jgi:hypothetical protein
MRAASSGPAGDSVLGAAQAWIPAVAQQGEWVQVDLGTEKRVGAVVTQGRADADEWVTLYRVEHSLDGVHFSTLGEYIANWTVNDAGTNANASFLSRTFTANSDRDTIVRAPWHTNTVARYVRVFPLAWHTAPALRLDVEAVAPSGTLSFSFGAAVVTATGGQYRLCWCALAPCVVASDYIVDLGELVIAGPSPLDVLGRAEVVRSQPLEQHRTCVAGQTCKVDNLESWDDRLPAGGSAQKW